MNKRLLYFCCISLILAGVGIIMLEMSCQRALELDKLILQPSLHPEKQYIRQERFRILDSWIPHWRISYSEVPTDTNVDSPAVSVDIFGRVVSPSSKEVYSRLEDLESSEN